MRVPPVWKVFLIVFAPFLLMGGCASLLFFGRRSWISPAPGVKLEPRLPVLHRAEILPGTGCAFFVQALRAANQTELKCRSIAVDLTGATPFSGTGELHRASSTYRSCLLRTGTARVARARRYLKPAILLAKQAVSAPDARMYNRDVQEIDRTFGKDLEVFQDFVSALAALGQAEVTLGNVDAGLDHLTLALRFAVIPSRGGNCVCYHSVAEAVASALEMEWRVARDVPLPSEQVRQRLRLLREVEADLEPLSEAFRMQYVASREFEEARLARVLEGGGGDDGNKIWRRVGAGLMGVNPRDVDACLRAGFSRLIALADSPYSRNRLEEFENEVCRKPVRWFTFRHGLATEIAWVELDGHTRDILTMLQVRALLRGVRLFHALRAWQREHGRPPERAGCMAPEWLAAVPEDPFMPGHPLRYVRQKDGAWAVYSVGPDQNDDRGRAAKFVPPVWEFEVLSVNAPEGDPAELDEERFRPAAGDIAIPSVPFARWNASSNRSHAERVEMPGRKRTGP